MATRARFPGSLPDRYAVARSARATITVAAERGDAMRRFGLLLVVLMPGLLAACGGSGDEYQLVIEVRADVNAPADFGVQPGEPIPDAELEVSGPDEGDRSFSAVTDEEGEATLELPTRGLYSVFVTAETNDPLCLWLGSDEVTVERERTTVLLDDLWVACE